LRYNLWLRSQLPNEVPTFSFFDHTNPFVNKIIGFKFGQQFERSSLAIILYIPKCFEERNKKVRRKKYEKYKFTSLLVLVPTILM
jgi:hypothetical protein